MDASERYLHGGVLEHHSHEVSREMSQSKTVVILGAGRAQIPVIARAHRLGYRVISPDRNLRAPGFEMSDYPLPGVSTHDPEAILRALRELEARAVRADGVLTVGVEASVSAAQVCEALSLPTVGVAVARRATDKHLRLQALQAARVSCPRFAIAHKLDDARHSANEIGYPVILKPTCAAGALGVVRCSDEAELESFWSHTASHAGDGVLIEEYLAGTEHSSESLVVSGRAHTTGFSDRNYDTKHLYPPHVLENGDTLPSALPELTLRATLLEVEAAIRALGIAFGAAKGDILVTYDGRPVILEMATRLSGDYFCTHTAPLHNGTDIVSAALQQCVGDPVDLDLLEPKRAQGVALRYVWPQGLPGTIRSIRGWNECASLDGVQFISWEPHWLDREIGVGRELTPPTSHRERAISVLVSGQTRAAAVALAEHVTRTVRVEVYSKAQWECANPATPSVASEIEQIAELIPRSVAPISTRYRTIRTALPVPASLPSLERLCALEPRSMRGQPPVVWERADEATICDPYGNRWIDFSSGVLVANVGHTAPEVVAAVRDQLEQGLIYSYGFPSRARLRGAEALARWLPEGYKAFLLTTGAESVENAIKLMRIEGRRRGGPDKRVVVSFENAFHGRTLGAQLAGGIPALKDWIGPCEAGFVQVPFPDPDPGRGASLDFEAFEIELDRMCTTPERVCGVLIESYQGGSGQFAPEAYVRRLREWCDAHGVLLTFDEVQAGFGRTGCRFAFEHYGVMPDLFVLGKAIAGGLPLAATVGRAPLMDACAPGTMTSTWSAHALGCAAMAATLERFERLGLVERARELGDVLHRRVGSWPQRFRCVGRTAGRGLMAAIEIVRADTREPYASMAQRVVQRCIERGVMLFAPVGPGGATLKLCPPLVIEREAMDEALGVVEECLADRGCP